jgi:hypothetical protein
MRTGFALGSITLIALYVLGQRGVSGRVKDASNVYVGLLRRVLSPDAAGIGNHSTPRTATPPASGGAGGRTPSFTTQPLVYFQS